MSTASFVECSIILEVRHGEAGRDALDLFIAEGGIELVPVDAEQARVARRAFSRFGKGRHTAGLNFGDCFSYALAKIMARPLLPNGADLTRTDLTAWPH